MDKALEKMIEYVERYWHKKIAGVSLPFVIAGLMVWHFHSKQPSELNTITLLISLFLGLTGFGIWCFAHRIPRVKKGNVGIVIGILCDDAAEEKQIKTDFIARVKKLTSDGPIKFQLIELPSWLLDDVDEHQKMEQLLFKTRGQLLLHGRARLRRQNGKETHCLAFEGIVRHLSVSKESSQNLSNEFARSLPRKVMIDKANDAVSFEVSSDWADVSVRFIIGITALMSNNFQYAETLFIDVQKKLPKIEAFGIKEISRLLPGRMRELYSSWLNHCYEIYFGARTNESLKDCDVVSSKLLALVPKHGNGLQIKAICEFKLRKDMSAAHRMITLCQDNPGPSWRYSRAFLLAYEGKLKESLSNYMIAFEFTVQGNIPIQCEEFINTILKDEPGKYQLHFCLGLINYYAKSDLIAARRDFAKFISSANPNDFKPYVLQAKSLMQECDNNLKPTGVLLAS